MQTVFVWFILPANFDFFIVFAMGIPRIRYGGTRTGDRNQEAVWVCRVRIGLCAERGHQYGAMFRSRGICKEPITV